MIPQYLTVQQVAQKLAVHPDTVKNWIVERKLTAVKIGQAYHIDEPDLKKLIDSRTLAAKLFT